MIKKKQEPESLFQWVEAFASKPDNLSLIPRIHMMERSNSNNLSSDNHMCLLHMTDSLPSTHPKEAALQTHSSLLPRVDTQHLNRERTVRVCPGVYTDFKLNRVLIAYLVYSGYYYILCVPKFLDTVIL